MLIYKSDKLKFMNEAKKVDLFKIFPLTINLIASETPNAVSLLMSDEDEKNDSVYIQCTGEFGQQCSQAHIRKLLSDYEGPVHIEFMASRVQDYQTEFIFYSGDEKIYLHPAMFLKQFDKIEKVNYTKSVYVDGKEYSQTYLPTWRGKTTRLFIFLLSRANVFITIRPVKISDNK